MYIFHRVMTKITLTLGPYELKKNIQHIKNSNFISLNLFDKSNKLKKIKTVIHVCQINMFINKQWLLNMFINNQCLLCYYVLYSHVLLLSLESIHWQPHVTDQTTLFFWNLPTVFFLILSHEEECWNYCWNGKKKQSGTVKNCKAYQIQ